MKLSSPLSAPVKTEVTTAATAREQRQQASAETRLNDARAAVESLKARSSNAAEEKKAVAKKNIEQIKARLQMLQMAMIGDPRGAARVAAQLARELGAAVKAYAAAGGSTAGLGAASGAPATDAGWASGDATSNEALVEAAAVAQPALDQGDGAARSSNPYQEAMDATQSRMAEQARRGGERQADSDLLGEVKRLAAQIKAMAQRAAKGSPEAEEADRAFAGLEHEFQAAVQAMPIAGVILTI